MNDDDDLPFSEPPVAEKDDHSEDETQVEEPDPVSEESRDVVREPLRLPQRRLRQSNLLLLLNRRKEWNRSQKKARVNVSELSHDAFLAEAARSKEKQWLGLHGREKQLFLEAASKQWNAWHENAATMAVPPAEAKVIWRTLRKQGLQDRVLQSRFVLVDKNEGKSHLRIFWIRRHLLVSWFLDSQIQMCSTFGETHQLLVVKPPASSRPPVPGTRKVDIACS